MPKGRLLCLSSLKYFCNCVVPENIHVHPKGRFMEIPRGRGKSKAQVFEQRYNTKMEFLEGWGFQTEKPSVGGVWIFSGTTHCQNYGISLGFSWGIFGHIQSYDMFRPFAHKQKMSWIITSSYTTWKLSQSIIMHFFGLLFIKQFTSIGIMCMYVRALGRL